MSYEPPITMDIFYENSVDKFAKQITEKQDHFIYTQMMAVSNIKIDEPELMRALAYDRGQYDAGYRDGWEARGEKIIRCDGCRYFYSMGHDIGRCANYGLELMPIKHKDDYCSNAERMEESGEEADNE